MSSRRSCSGPLMWVISTPYYAVLFEGPAETAETKRRAIARREQCCARRRPAEAHEIAAGEADQPEARVSDCERAHMGES